MASNNVAFVADGVKTVFPNPLAQLPGAVLVNGVSTAFTWTDGNTITFASPPVAGAIVSMVPGSVEITETSEEAPRSEFVPDHRWTGTSLQFRRPDGSFGAGVELSPDPAALPFLAAGPSAVARPWVDKARDHFHLRDYGAPTAGDNSALINAAIAAVNVAGGGYLTMPPGTVPASAITLLGGVTLIGSGKAITSKILNLGTVANMIECQGSYGSPVALLSDALAGDTQIAITSTVGLAAGDVIAISDAFDYSPVSAAGYKSGEAAYIASVDSATQLTLRARLYGSAITGGSYTVANGSVVRKLALVSAAGLADFEINGDWASVSNAAHFLLTKDLKVENVYVKEFGNSAFYLQSCIGAQILNSGCDNLRDEVGIGRAGYGVAVRGPCDAVVIRGGDWSRCRHAVTTIGDATGYPHDLTVADLVVHNTTTAGLDTHNAGDNIKFLNNSVSKVTGSAISIRTRNTVIQGGSLFDATGSAVNIVSTEGVFNVTVEGVDIYLADGFGVACAYSCPGLRVLRNRLREIGLDGISLFGSGTIDSTGVEINYNDIQGFSRVAVGRTGIITTGAVNSTGAQILGNTIDGKAYAPGYAIRTLFLTDSAVVGNRARGTYSAAVWGLASNLDIDNRKLDATNGRLVLNDTNTILQAVGPNPDYDVIVQPKGTGHLRFVYPWTSNADAAIDGYMEIRDSTGTIRKLATIA